MVDGTVYSGDVEWSCIMDLRSQQFGLYFAVGRNNNIRTVDS